MGEKRFCGLTKLLKLPNMLEASERWRKLRIRNWLLACLSLLQMSLLLIQGQQWLMEPTGRELLIEEGGKEGRNDGEEETDKTQASLLPGTEALENKFGNIIPQDFH